MPSFSLHFNAILTMMSRVCNATCWATLLSWAAAPLLRLLLLGITALANISRTAPRGLKKIQPKAVGVYFVSNLRALSPVNQFASRDES